MICVACKKNKDVFHLTITGIMCKCCLFWERYPVNKKQERRTHDEIVLLKRRKFYKREVK